MSTLEHLSDRAVIRLTGEDRISFLQGLITQDAALLNAAPAMFAALLTPQGKILFDFIVVADGDALLIDCRRDSAEALLKRLTLYKLRAKVALALDGTLAVAASDQEITDGAAFADPRTPALGWRALVPAGAGGGEDAYHRRRIGLGAPEFGADFPGDDKFLLDVNYDALNGVSYKKGCFVGQEVTSRMKRKGDVRRRTLIAEFEGAAPEQGAPITAGGSTLGELMSAADGAGLAQIRLDRWQKAAAEGAPIECAGRALRLRIPGYLE